MSESKRVFLSAEWRDLVMLNYEVDPALLTQHIPSGTSLDSYRGKTYISLVGFRFCRTKLFGHFPVPFHANFDEVNLRFYVRRKDEAKDHGLEDRRGVVFIAEVVPRRAIAATARLLYGENYRCLPMKHNIETHESGTTLEYRWRADRRTDGRTDKKNWCRLSAQTVGLPMRPNEGSLEQFITEHYWGYSAQPGGRSVEYHVSHVPWQVWPAAVAGFEGEAASLYGRQLADILHRRHDSAFVAAGSPVIVYRGERFR